MRLIDKIFIVLVYITVLVIMIYLGLLFGDDFRLFLDNLLALIMILVLIFGIIGAFAYYYKVGQVRKNERIENYQQGATKERSIYRDLEKREKEFLKEKFKKTGKNEFDLDLRSPVFRVIGKVLIHQNEKVKIWKVRDFEIAEKNFPEIKNKIFAELEEVAVEFSPFSNWVWDVYGFESGRREWVMKLSESVYEDLKDRKLSVIPRAPFGSHNLPKLRRHDLISFSNNQMDNIVVEVTKTHHYQSTEELLEAEGLNNVFPYSKTIEEGVNLLNNIEDYKSRIKEGGIYAIGIKYLN